MTNASLLRLPSRAFPTDLRSGDARIDTYLQALDAALVGTAGIRRPTLLETRDHLLEARDRARGTGADEDAAVRAAIAGFGAPEGIAAGQRRGCASRFVRLALGMGLAFAALMLVFGWLAAAPGKAMSWPVMAAVSALNALLFGVPMGVLFSYVIPAAMPAGEARTAGGFRVHYTRRSRWLAGLMLVASGALQAMLALGLAGRGPLDGWQAPALAFLLVVNLKNLLAALDGLLFRAHVDGDALSLRGLAGPARLRRDQVLSVRRCALAVQLAWPAYGNVHRLQWRDDAGRIHHRHVSLNRDLVHGDRLLAWLEAGARATTTPGGPRAH